jgi:hypothetical protein
MADPRGQIFLTYEHPAGSNKKGKNTSDSFVSSVTGTAKAVGGSVDLFASAVNSKINSIFK